MARKKRAAAKESKSSTKPKARADDAPARSGSKNEADNSEETEVAKEDDEKKDVPQVEKKPQESEAEKESKDESKDESETDSKKASSKKRKVESETDSSSKSSRRSGRGPSKGQPSREQLYNFLLSKEAEDLSRPQDEKDALEENADLKTYSTSVFTPFEELICAIVLSRPISHRLGLRSIRTIFSDPYNFTTARAIDDAGEEKRHQALWDAKTQHKGKTADQLGLVAKVVLEKFTSSKDKDGAQLTKVLEDSDGDIDDALATLKENIKGLGETGLNIFLRRVQWLWDAGYPFVDGKTRLALRELGLPGEADELKKDLESHWKALRVDRVAGKSEDEKKRRAFVMILERAIGADLENQLQNLRAAAADA
jgi:hypothetical protein